ncbi:hypothetical protein TNIN_561 [Trichonephila inaurata madagascariensis]|uniref:Uncharacterized protein n=1 Tax=Trichonephila inaurata madagascariensis TaxID=2747483 RepID=A0A8X6WPB3_9ARAC|nr:hypothetical protein TNIN_561 [Trichonephila inaurata madagascariensis]
MHKTASKKGFASFVENTIYRFNCKGQSQATNFSADSRELSGTKAFRFSYKDKKKSRHRIFSERSGLSYGIYFAQPIGSEIIYIDSFKRLAYVMG